MRVGEVLSEPVGDFRRLLRGDDDISSLIGHRNVIEGGDGLIEVGHAVACCVHLGPELHRLRFLCVLLLDPDLRLKLCRPLLFDDGAELQRLLLLVGQLIGIAQVLVNLLKLTTNSGKL